MGNDNERKHVAHVRLLVVEADTERWEATSFLLQQIENLLIDVDRASCPTDAAEKIIRDRHDLVLLSERVDEADGFDVLRATTRGGYVPPTILLRDDPAGGDRDGNGDGDGGDGNGNGSNGNGHGTAERAIPLGAARARPGITEELRRSELDATTMERAIVVSLDRSRSLARLHRTTTDRELTSFGADEGRFEWDLTTGELRVSEGWRRTIGHTASDREVDARECASLETREFWFERVHPADIDRLEAEIRAHLFGIAPTLRCEYRMRHMDGTYRWISTRGIVARDEAGKPLRIHGSSTDVTDRRIAAESVLARLCREIRDPVESIHHYVRLVLEGGRDALDEDQRGELKRALACAFRVERHVRDLSDVTRANACCMFVEPRPFILEKPIDDLVAADPILCELAEQKALDFEHEPPPEPYIVFADRDRVRQILECLLHNAAKFTPSGSRVRTRIFRSDDRADMICIEVRDEGHGIPPGRADRLFDRLYEPSDPAFEPTDPREGPGVGLYLAKELVVRQGGRIWVDSEPGSGASFRFTLPEFSEAAV